MTILLQAQGNPTFPLIFMVGMIAVMYFFMIRPQAKRAKEQKKFSEAITAGEKIVTTAGIHAVINRVNDDGTLQIEVSRGTFMTIDRSAVSMEMTNAARKKAEAVAVAK
ncbi:preprotein translocase subunit YajC [Chitinophagaceae bacterium IBVUCB1]|nr:preprotein translocase subunit YajC [Chitinophagaceae bacterium IBVUCB1]